MTGPAEITQETSQQKISFLLCGFFLICAMLWNPGIYTSLGKASYLPFFTPAALVFWPRQSWFSVWKNRSFRNISSWQFWGSG